MVATSFVDTFSIRHSLPCHIFNDAHFEVGPAAWWQHPCAQVILRGEETVEGARTKTAQSIELNVQRMYPDHNLVIWSEVHMWVGYVLERRITTQLLQLLFVLTTVGGLQE